MPNRTRPPSTSDDVALLRSKREAEYRMKMAKYGLAVDKTQYQRDIIEVVRLGIWTVDEAVLIMQRQAAGMTDNALDHGLQEQMQKVRRGDRNAIRAMTPERFCIRQRATDAPRNPGHRLAIVRRGPERRSTNAAKRHASGTRRRATASSSSSGDDGPLPDAADEAARRLARAEAELEAQRRLVADYLARVLSRTHDSLLADQIWSDGAA